MNLAGDDRSAAFVTVHVVIAVVSLALAVPVALVGRRLLRKDSGGEGRNPAG